MTHSGIPPAAAYGWTVALAVVVLVHVWHLTLIRGRHRLWHGGHILMALGMITMFLPGLMTIVPSLAGTLVFALAALALAAYLLLALVRGGGIGVVWFASVLDLAWMAFMFAEMDGPGVTWLNVVGAVWFGAQAVGWISGLLGRVVDRHGLGSAATSAEPEEHHHGIVDGGAHDWSVRLSLTVMGLGMAYMFLALNSGMPGMEQGHSMPGMSSDHDMPGMSSEHDMSPMPGMEPQPEKQRPAPSSEPMPDMPGMPKG
ncbi:MAG TPA: DUF5134 domain-containing protein [Pseudonocardia sp.]|jgi:hypothetical protein|nr:DUF5134 domain-containing protein [Pseudonocardia sp.]